MTQKLTKTALLLIPLLTVLVLYACKDDDESDLAYPTKFYFGTTYNLVDNYFTPKKLNICSYRDSIIFVDWFANEFIGTNNPSPDMTRDWNQEYAIHYHLISKELEVRYWEIADSITKGRVMDLMIDEDVILSPYKEYAAFYGDTLCLSRHHTYDRIYGLNVCVLPVIGIDVVCDKDFDTLHPAGTSLNDLIRIIGINNTYGCLHEMGADNKPLYYGKKDYEFNTAPNSSLEDIPLNTIPDNPILMMDSHFYMRFVKSPSTPGTYECTVKFSFGADPLTGDTVDIAPAKVSLNFLSGKQH